MGMIWGNTKPPLGTQINWQHPLSKGIVGCWLMNEGMGDKVNDLSGNKNTGTLMNFSHPSTPTSGWNPGKFGKSLAFDGSNDYISLPNCYGKYISNNNFHSVSLWVMIKNLNQIPVFWATTGMKGEIIMIMDATHFYWGYSAYGYGFRVYSGTFLNNYWYHIGVVKNGSGNVGDAYINGIKLTSYTSQLISPITVNPLDIVLGYYSLNRNLNGMLDFPIIYNRALSSQEVLQLYKEPFCMFNT